MKAFRYITRAFFVLVCVAAAPSAAQAASFDIRMTPQNPAPHEQVFLSVSALEFNIDLSNISWSVDGKVQDSGMGRKTFSTVAPASGKSALVLVKVSPDIGGALERSVQISPAGVDLIWEATDSYVPPFYRGKALPISQGQVKVVAVPNAATASGILRPASAFAYTWRKDGKNVPNQSGLGKASLAFANQILDKQNRVELVATDGLKTVEGSIIVVPFTPEIIFYEESQMRGVLYQKAFGSIEETSAPRVAVVAEPYFLSKNFLTNPDIASVWKLNDQEIKSDRKNVLAINTRNTTGNVSISFAYSDARRLFRDIKNSMILNIK